MKPDDILSFVALILENWQLSLGVAAGWLGVTYLGAYIKAFASAKGKLAAGVPEEKSSDIAPANDVSNEPQSEISDSPSEKNLASSVLQWMESKFAIIAMIVTVASIATVWALSIADPCLKPASQMTIGEKTQCDIH